MLEINNLHVKADNKEILKGMDLSVQAGEIHALMGPNGSGKSTLASLLAGKQNYEITDGEILYDGKNLAEMPPEDRAKAGIFLAFQYPVEIPGVSNREFLKTIVNAHRQAQSQDTMDTFQFKKFLAEQAELNDFPSELLDRNLNEGFSGGEKKRNEILQMSLLNPKLKILDETDSGLDIDALKIVAQGIDRLHGKDSATIVITHYNRILSYLDVDHVHIVSDGKIIKSGGRELAKEIEEKGYESFIPKGPLKVIK